MNCNIIKDLLPSFIDGICSQDSCKVVEEHLQQCEECRKYKEIIEQSTNAIQILPNEVTVAKAPFKKINKKRRIQIVLSILLTFMLTVIGSFVVQEVGVVNEIFFPRSSAIIEITDNQEEWDKLYFDDQDYLTFTNIFWNKEIVNDANNEGDVWLRIKDENDNIVVDEFRISPGKSMKLDTLKNTKSYSFEIKANKGRFSINVF